MAGPWRASAGIFHGLEFSYLNMVLYINGLSNSRDTDALDVTVDLERLGSITSIPLLEIRR